MAIHGTAIITRIGDICSVNQIDKQYIEEMDNLNNAIRKLNNKGYYLVTVVYEHGQWYYFFRSEW